MIRVLGGDGMEGRVTDARGYKCQLSGCPGRRIRTVWPDGQVTFPCTQGMEWCEREQAYLLPSYEEGNR